MQSLTPQNAETHASWEMRRCDSGGSLLDRQHDVIACPAQNASTSIPAPQAIKTTPLP